MKVRKCGQNGKLCYEFNVLKITHISMYSKYSIYAVFYYRYIEFHIFGETWSLYSWPIAFGTETFKPTH